MAQLVQVSNTKSIFLANMNDNDIPDSLVDMIIAYETGELSADNTIALFQALIDTKLVWQMQGQYENFARQLITAGICSIPNAA